MQHRHPRKSHQQWKSLIDKFHNQSELTRQQFCDTEQLSLRTFQKWLYKFAAQERNAAAPAGQSTRKAAQNTPPAFGPVMIRPSSQLALGCCMELPGNVLLHTQSLPSVEYLQNLVKVFGYER